MMNKLPCHDYYWKYKYYIHGSEMCNINSNYCWDNRAFEKELLEARNDSK